MDTILNLGMSDAVVKALADYTKNPRFAFDTYRCFMRMFGVSVLKINKTVFDDIEEGIFSRNHVRKKYNLMTDLTIEDITEIIAEFKKVVAIPEDVYEQLHMAIEAGFASFTTPNLVHPLQELEKLSPREKDIFFLIAKSLSNKHIARELDIAETTVKIHIQHIFKKLNLTSRVQIAIFVASHRLT